MLESKIKDISIWLWKKRWKAETCVFVIIISGDRNEIQWCWHLPWFADRKQKLWIYISTINWMHWEANQTIQITRRECSNDSSRSYSQNVSSIPTNVQYRKTKGRLIYLSIVTRPDITFAVNKASPRKLHKNAVKRIIKYVRGTKEFGLLF